MAEACGGAGMLIEEFWNATPREVFNKIKGFYDLEKMRREYDWTIARAMTFNIAASMVGSDKIDYHKMSYFPASENPDRVTLTPEQTKAIIVKMDAHMKNPKGKVIGTAKELKQWASM